jgi:hypothetical protein
MQLVLAGGKSRPSPPLTVLASAGVARMTEALGEFIRAGVTRL